MHLSVKKLTAVPSHLFISKVVVAVIVVIKIGIRYVINCKVNLEKVFLFFNLLKFAKLFLFCFLLIYLCLRNSELRGQ